METKKRALGIGLEQLFNNENLDLQSFEKHVYETTDKEEIIEISRKIDTFETSILPYEDCCTVFTPKHPKTRPSLESCEEAEANLAIDELIEKAISETVYTYID